MATVNHATRAGIFILSLTGLVCWSSGCNKTPDPFDQNWTVPMAISSSFAGLGGAVRVHKYQDSVIGVQAHKGSVQIHRWDHVTKLWVERSVVNTPSDYLWYGAGFGPQSEMVFVPQAFCENEQLVMKILIGQINENGAFSGFVERQCITEKRALIGETGPNVKLNAYSKREGIGLGPIIVRASAVHIPFSLRATTLFGINNASNGPFANGVFYSSDSGMSWRMEKISEQDAIAPALCATEEHVYYFAGNHPLWSSRKVGQAGQWEKVQTIAKTFAIVNGHFAVAGGGNTAHICWMDRRHNKTRFNLTGPPIENNDIYYRRRKDTDPQWSKEVLLSRGLLYCYAPTISAEGDNVVVVWAGIKAADKQHTDMGPNDIFYVVSKDSGETWTSPRRVTDGAKDGITAGMPQVALLNGTIHLLYIQGSQRQPTELSPGLTKLGQGPWPIYHQQRPFPN